MGYKNISIGVITFHFLQRDYEFKVWKLPLIQFMNTKCRYKGNN